MQVRALIELLAQQDPEATVVVCDRNDFVRSGLIRPLKASELSAVQLGEVAEGDERWVCAWSERSVVDCDGPMPGLLLGPP